MFAFVFRDGASGAVYLVRDRFGEKPLYWGHAQGRLVFASEVPVLRCHPTFRETGFDRQAAYGLLVFEYLPGSTSGWSGNRKARVWHNTDLRGWKGQLRALLAAAHRRPGCQLR